MAPIVPDSAGRTASRRSASTAHRRAAVPPRRQEQASAIGEARRDRDRRVRPQGGGRLTGRELPHLRAAVAARRGEQPPVLVEGEVLSGVPAQDRGRRAANAHEAVVVASCDKSARPERDGRRERRSPDRPQRTAARRGPDPHGVVAAGGRELTPVAAEGGVLDPGRVPAEGMQQAPVAGAPDSRDTVDAAADDERAVRTEAAACTGPSWPPSTRTWLPLVASQIRTVPSSPPVTTNRPPRERSAACTAPRWPRRTRTTRPLFRSQIRTAPSSRR